ncbi:MAG: hypothetical protein PHC51_12000 [bacterium]|nr:hypothetical protein [bacterium]
MNKALNQPLVDLLCGLSGDLDLDAGLDDVKYRRIMDLMISTGRLSSRFRHQPGISTQLDLVFPVFSDTQWLSIIKLCSGNSLYLATLLAGDLSEEFTSALAEMSIHLLPRSHQELVLTSTGDEQQTRRHLAALYWSLAELLLHQPFSLFSLRGRGRQEVLSELKMIRSAEATSRQGISAHPYKESAENQPSELPAQNIHQRYWRLKPAALKLAYRLKADELPAALLRRLQTPPVGILEEQAESLLDELYDYITRRAQGYAIDLSNNDRHE